MSHTGHAFASSASLHLHAHHQDALWQMSMISREKMESGYYPLREGEPDCAYYTRTGLCRFGATCRFNHPPNRNLASATARMKGEYPERIGQPECQFYLKTGTCKFGATCKFHHPRDKAGAAGRVALNVLGYPLRPNEVKCAFYMRNGQCKYGSTCKFHHPQPSNMMVSLHGSALYPSIHSASTNEQSVSQASFIPGPQWQSTSCTQLIMPQGVMPVPWNTYDKVGSVSPSENQQQTAGHSQNDGTSCQAEGINVGFQFHINSLSVGHYALERDYMFPERPGQPECQFYVKTGDCKFGAVCKFHHPRERRTHIPNCVVSPIGLPLRPGETPCVFYSRYGVCKFGPSCKFDHPMRAFAHNAATSSSSTDEPALCRLMASSSETVALSSPPDTSNRRISLTEARQLISLTEGVLFN